MLDDSDSTSAHHNCTLNEHLYETITFGPKPAAATTTALPEPTVTVQRPTAVALQQQHNGQYGGNGVEAAAMMSPSMSSGASGSLITMTMKNNQLIVETEERNVSHARASGRTG